VGKNVAVFVDVANIFYAAKAAGVDIDYVTLLKSAIAGRDFVRAYAYTGLDPDNENQRNFHNFLARHGYKVVSKDIRKYGDGKVKANLDIELVVDMLKTARNLDVAIVVSGDGDFAPAIRAVQEMGVRVEVISFRGNTSSDLIDVADLFTDIVQIARVEKGSSRSGRRVADDGEDLSMTEVPDKLTEGTGRGRGRGTGRGRGRTGDAEREPVAATAARSTRGGTRTRRAEPEVEVVAATGAGVGLIALPGEKLSKAALARLEAAGPVEAAAPVAADGDEPIETELPAEEGPAYEGEGPRRRRRRGGRGRGRGRGRAEAGELELTAPGIEAAPTLDAAGLDEPAPEDDQIVASRPRGPRPGAFGSVWDSQIGQTRTPSVESTPFDIDEDDEPAIPEYLIAEQRRGGSSARPGNRQGGRGGRGGGYNAAVDRERYGRGGGGGGINRYPDVSGRGSGGGGSRGGRDPRRDDRPPSAARPERERPAAGRSDEPWSEVPPELEAILRAQLAGRSESRPAESPTTGDAPRAEAAADEPGAGRATRTSARRTATPADAAPVDEASAAPKRRTSTRKPASKSSATASATGATAGEAPTRRASTRKPAAKASADRTAAAQGAEGAEAAPKRRTSTRKKAEPSEA
jgi:uncharacterized LabA/DUF88 family protein